MKALMTALTFATAALSAVTIRPAAAEPSSRYVRLPGHQLAGQYCGVYPDGSYQKEPCWFFDSRKEVYYRKADGDQIVDGYPEAMIPANGYEYRDVPSFLRIVYTPKGPRVRGIPQPGDYKISVWQHGERVPTLETPLRFIPRD
jgi:hypothetical protein